MRRKSKKEEQFMAFYAEVHERFERFCKARAYGDVSYKDLMHDTVLVAYEKFTTIQPANEKVFLHFLFGTRIRILANMNRKKKPLHFNEDAAILQVEDDKNNPDRRDDVHLLYHALSKLPEAQREAIVLFEISGFSIAEISDLQSVGISAVKQRLARGRKALLELLTTETGALRKEVNYDK